MAKQSGNHGKLPLKSPWPPGVDWRIVDGGPLGRVFQLRPGASLPRYFYVDFMLGALYPSFHFGDPVCLN